MDARRWSPLWVFAGGCLTGAALIGMHMRGAPESASSGEPASDVAPRSVKADAAEERAQVEPAASAPAVVAREQGDAPEAAEREKAESGNYVAEVLARLETEYRERSAPPPAAAPAPKQAEALPAKDEPAAAPANEPPRELAQAQPQTAVSEASAPKLATSERAVVVRPAAPAAEASPADAPVASLSADGNPTASVAEEAVRLALIRGEQAKALDDGQKQLAQMQQLAALQQTALLEQYTLFQLQLLSQSQSQPQPQSPASPSTVITAPTRRSQRRNQPRGGRIVASLPSSISDMDNPWGFNLQRSVLVR